MATTQGFAGTIELETRGTARIWFGLTDSGTRRLPLRTRPHNQTGSSSFDDGAWLTLLG